MIELASKVVENGHGYVTEGGDVYCTSHTVEGYGRLSRVKAGGEEDEG